MADTLLVIEDEALLRGELERHYRRENWEMATASTVKEARSLLVDEKLAPLVVVSDMSLPDGNALDLLAELRKGRDGSGSEWIFLTGYGSVPDSVRALHLGAFDFLEKPCELERLDVIVSGAARSARAQRRLRDQALVDSLRYSPDSFLGRSNAAAQVREMLNKLRQVPFSAVVFTGETGTGKELAARILHHGGLRGHGPLVDVNCAALPKDLLESELFGHEAGAFTGAKGRHRGLMEKADGGTLFLDEIAEMPVDLQGKILKAIEDRTFRRLGSESETHVDVQIIAATNRDLEKSVKEGSFRSDLYHRLSVFRVVLPPLRERKEDLEDLVPFFIAEFNAKAGRNVKTLSDSTWRRLNGHEWPGNVRELRNVIERCVLFADGEEFPERWLQLTSEPMSQVGPLEKGATGERVVLPLDGSMDLEDMDRFIIKTALELNDYNVSATARALGTTRETLRYRIQKYGLGAAEAKK